LPLAKVAGSDFGLPLDPDVALATVALSPRIESAQTPEAAAARRALEFRAGRSAAALALARFDVFAEVSRGSDGCPIWPPGFVGSISHGATFAVAAVAHREALRGIGIDVERVLESSACADIRERVATAEEYAVLHAAYPALREEERVTVLFSCKESLYKCLYPQVGNFFDFTDVRVSAAVSDPDSLAIGLELVRDLAPSLRSGARFDAIFALRASIVRTAVLDRGGLPSSRVTRP